MKTVLHSLVFLLAAFQFSACDITMNSGGSWEKTVLLAYPAYDAITAAAVQWYADHADMLIIAEYQADKAQAIRNLNNDVMLLLYKTTLNSADELHGAPGYAYVNAAHPEWFLHERDYPTRRLTLERDGYLSKVFWMNNASKGWREYWTDSVVQDVVKQGWDGVYMDSVHYMITSYWAPHGIKEYPSDELWNMAMAEFLEHANEELDKVDAVIIGNYSDNSQHPGAWEEYLQVSDGGLEEGFVNISQWSSEVWRPEAEWQIQISAMEEAGRLGKIYYAMAHNRGVGTPQGKQDVVFNLASYLLGRENDKTYFYNAGIEGYVTNNFIVDYDAYEKFYSDLYLGKPLGSRYKAAGVWYREFEDGVVAVNPSSRSRSLSLSQVLTDYDSGADRADGDPIAAYSAYILMKP